MTGLKRDLHYAVRMFRRTPLFSSMATLVLAVAIGVATAVFSLYSHLELQPVAGIQGSSRLVSVGFSRQDTEWLPLSIAQAEQLSALLQTPEFIVGTSFPRLRDDILVRGSEVEARVTGVTRGYFSDLGIRLLLGADLDDASADPTAKIVVISERFWRDAFDAAPGAIGESIKLGETDYTVVGVAGGGFQGLRRNLREDAWVPIDALMSAFGPSDLTEAQRLDHARRAPALSLYGRLPAGSDIDVLRREAAAVMPRLRDAWNAFWPADLMRLEVLPGSPASPRVHHAMVRQTELLVGGALLILLVASLNLASFFIARGTGRLQELRTRLAIGASRGAVMRQLFIESAVLVAIATALGLLLHFWLKTLLLRVPPFIDRWSGLSDVASDWRVFVFIGGAAVVVAAVTGLVPATRIAFQPTLTGGQTSALGRHSGRLQPLLALQVLVATLVVLAGTLFIADLKRLEQLETGFDASDLLVGRLQLDRSVRRSTFSFTSEQGDAYRAALDERLGELPGLDGIAFASHTPFSDRALNPGAVDVAGGGERLAEEQRRTYENAVSPEFFRVMRIPFIQGRAFEPLESDVVVVSRAFARRLWGRDDVVGEQFHPADGVVAMRGGGAVAIRQQVSGEQGRTTYTIVGVVDDVRYDNMSSAPPVWYRLMGGYFGASFVARGAVDSALLGPLVDETVREYMSPFILGGLEGMSAQMRDSLRNERARSRLAAGAAFLALLLTMIGLYASMQHTVEARRGELAVRKAIGASDDRIVVMILRRAFTIVVLGAVGALLVAVVFAERLSGLLFGLDATDPRAWGTALVVVCVTGVLAAWLPARRAGTVDPAVALRYE